MIGKSGKDGDLMSSLGPVVGEFSGAGGGCAHLGREVLGDVEDFHATVEGIANLHPWKFSEPKCGIAPCNWGIAFVLALLRLCRIL
jgi:hypothetical protein